MAVVHNYSLSQYLVEDYIEYVANNADYNESTSTAYRLHTPDGFNLYLTGSNFQYDSSDNVTGGTIKSIKVYSDSDASLPAEITDLSLDFKAFYDAVNSLRETGSDAKLESIFHGTPYAYEGFNGVDWFNGSNYHDHIMGFGGNDELDGLRGNDTIDGGDGWDKIWGKAGEDVLVGHLL